MNSLVLDHESGCHQATALTLAMRCKRLRTMLGLAYEYNSTNEIGEEPHWDQYTYTYT